MSQYRLLEKSKELKVLFVFLNQTYVAGTQKNYQIETVLLSTKNLYVMTYGLENLYNFVLNIIYTLTHAIFGG